MYGTQTWSVGISVQPSQAAPPSPSQLDAWLTALDGQLQAWWNGSTKVGNTNAPLVKYIGARAFAYAANTAGAVSQADHQFTAALAGQASTSNLPLQTSVVSSMLSGTPGRSFRGRRYLPFTAGSLTSNQLAPTTVDQLTAAEVSLLNTINATALGTGLGTVVIANKKDFPALIRSVRIDSECDIQRRRADKIVGTYFKTTALT